MSVIADTYAQMEAARQLVAQIQEECCHPEAGLRKRPTHRVESVWEDNPDGYVGEFRDVNVPQMHYTCGLCGHTWKEDVAEDDN